nr:uncharacterized protein LOC113819969 [Penaeus vannamei]
MLEATDACCIGLSERQLGFTEYFEQLYQLDCPAVSLDARDATIPVPDPPISEDLHTLNVVREAISKLNDEKAAGVCDIPAELPKAGGEPIARGFIPRKIFAQIVLKRIRNHLLRLKRPEQFGFTPGKSTIDHILTLRVIVEHCHHFSHGLLTAYINLKKAFYSGHHKLLWRSRHFGEF